MNPKDMNITFKELSTLHFCMLPHPQHVNENKQVSS